MVKKYFDICIIGGALNGLLAALVLSKLNLKIAVIDRNPLEHFIHPPFDGRTTAISYGSSRFIKCHLPQLWEALEQQIGQISDIYITHDQEPEYIHYGPNESDEHTMGYIVHNQYFKKLLYKEILQVPQVSLIENTTFNNIITTPSSQEIELSNSQMISCNLLIAADGTKSAVRQKFNFKLHQFSYNQTALSFLVVHTEPHNGRAFEHFIPCGPLAFLPLSDYYQSSVVWSLNNDTAANYLNLSTAELAYHLNQNFQETLGELKIISAVHQYPLSCTLLQSYIAPRLVLIGDAAHTIHPVAGQGFNLGLRDTQYLFNTLEKAQSLGLDIANQSLLQTYQKQRRFDILSMTVFTDSMVRLFSNDIRILTLLRSYGLKAVNTLNPLKKILARRAMGINIL